MGSVVCVSLAVLEDEAVAFAGLTCLALGAGAAGAGRFFFFSFSRVSLNAKEPGKEFRERRGKGPER
jgi:hypothetical protein